MEHFYGAICISFLANPIVLCAFFIFFNSDLHFWPLGSRVVAVQGIMLVLLSFFEILNSKSCT